MAFIQRGLVLLLLSCVVMACSGNQKVATTEAKKSQAKPATPVKTSDPCSSAGKLVTRASSACAYGLAAIVGPVLMVPKACRIPMGEGAVDRHSVEIRDAKTGKRRGQASLTATAVQPNSPPPRVGALIAGDYPVYVFSGGIAAIDPARRKAELVLESSGALLGAVRHGEVLSVVDGVAASKAFPNGASEWTVIDFGSGEMLGQVAIAGRALDGLGFTAEATGLVAWLRRPLRDKTVELFATVRDKSGAAVSKDGRLRAKIRDVGKASELALPLPPTPKRTPLFTSTEPVLVARPPVMVSAGRIAVHGTMRTRFVAKTADDQQAPRAVVQAKANGPQFAWFAPQQPGATPSLRAVKCVIAPRQGGAQKRKP